MPRTLLQAAGFLMGLWIALWLSPFVGCARSTAVLAAPHADLGAPAPARYAALEADLYERVNRVRAQRRLIALERRADLDAVARAHSRDMVARHYFAHETPEGLNPLDRLERASVSGFSMMAENIGITDQPDPNREILEAWLQSTLHRRNLYTPPFNATGIGIAQAPNGSLVYTQIYVTYPR